MGQIYEQVLKYMEATVHELAKRVPAPKQIRTNNWVGYRHVESPSNKQWFRNSPAW